MDLITSFQTVRDIPFGPLPGDREDDRVARMLRGNKGSCTAKHYYLCDLLESEGMSTLLVTYPFRWKELDINYPRTLLEHAERMPLAYHLACKANISGGWVLLDATWDPPLEKLGFNVNDWDGSSDTTLAVRPLDEVVHETRKQRIEYIRNNRCYGQEQLQTTLEFHRLLDSWLQSAR